MNSVTETITACDQCGSTDMGETGGVHHEDCTLCDDCQEDNMDEFEGYDAEPED